MTKWPKLALIGIILLDLGFAIDAAVLLYSRSYFVGGASALTAIYVFWGLLQGMRRIRQSSKAKPEILRNE